MSAIGSVNSFGGDITFSNHVLRGEVSTAKQVKVELAQSRITRGLSAMVTFMSCSELSIEVEMNSLYGPVSLSVKL